MYQLKIKTMNKHTLENGLQKHEFIGKVFNDHLQANHVAINKAFAHPDYGFRTVVLDEGFAVVGKKKGVNSYQFSEVEVKVNRDILK